MSGRAVLVDVILDYQLVDERVVFGEYRDSQAADHVVFDLLALKSWIVFKEPIDPSSQELRVYLGAILSEPRLGHRVHGKSIEGAHVVHKVEVEDLPWEIGH